jgi:flagellin
MRINNTGGLNTASSSSLVSAKPAEKLSSGLRINRAGDDAAGLAIAAKMAGQVRGLGAASRNVSDSISMVRTAEGGLNQTHSILQRMRELAVQSANAIYTDADRRELQAEVGQLRSEIDRIGNATEFNTRSLLDGGAGGAEGSVGTQSGANGGQMSSVSIGDMRSGALGLGGLDIGTQSGASDAIEAIDSAIEAVSRQRGQLGATENGFEHAVRNLDAAAENAQAAQSRISDADMARAAMEQTRDGILQQASMAMAAQANMARQSVLQLLG